MTDQTTRRIDPISFLHTSNLRCEPPEEPEAEKIKAWKIDARRELTSVALSIVALLAQDKLIYCDYNGHSSLPDVERTTANIAELLASQIFDNHALNTVFLVYKNDETDLTN